MSAAAEYQVCIKTSMEKIELFTIVQNILKKHWLI